MGSPRSKRVAVHVAVGSPSGLDDLGGCAIEDALAPNALGPEQDETSDDLRHLHR